MFISDLERIREGTGYRCAMIIQYIFTFLSGVTIGLYVNAKLTLIVLCVGPFLVALNAYSAAVSILIDCTPEIAQITNDRVFHRADSGA